MGWWARLWGRDSDDYDEYDLDGDADEGVACPGFDCGCRRCALLARLCIHEAGHIVTHLALRVPFDHAYATVGGDNGTNADGGVIHGEYHHIEGDELIDHIVCAMAGAAAETLHYGEVAMADGDDETINAYLTGPAAHTIADMSLEGAEVEAGDIVDNWGDQLDMLARELFAAGTLTYAECAVYA